DIKTGQTQSRDELSRNGGQASQVSAEKSVTTSPTAFNKIKELLVNEPEVRADKVAELKAKIKNGEYQINHERLAGKMIQESLNELKSRG
ncbi:MAG: flagellar biosynthesis anti-sigma factor FlgM, partial [SAR324 cluster bacterium]|nr:flagellar biosynthesis anti-sigma factor FlgM [SAR324 cluster bacterium]